jgi:hypothetical protein
MMNTRMSWILFLQRSVLGLLSMGLLGLYHHAGRHNAH